MSAVGSGVGKGWRQGHRERTVSGHFGGNGNGNRNGKEKRLGVMYRLGTVMKGIVHTSVSHCCVVHASLLLLRTYHAHARAVRARKSTHVECTQFAVSNSHALHCMQGLTVPLFPRPKGRKRKRKRNDGTASPFPVTLVGGRASAPCTVHQGLLLPRPPCRLKAGSC